MRKIRAFTPTEDSTVSLTATNNNTTRVELNTKGNIIKITNVNVQGTGQGAFYRMGGSGVLAGLNKSMIVPGETHYISRDPAIHTHVAGRRVSGTDAVLKIETGEGLFD